MNDFHVKSVEMADSTKHEEGNAVILFSGKHEGYKMKVSLKKSEQTNANGILFPYPNTLLIENIRRNLLLVWEWCMFEEVSI